jgi:small-conductance mechanosensitive channel
MPELDRLKEEVAYRKFWQGVAVVTLVSVAGWLITNGSTADSWSFALAVAGVISLGIGVVVLGRQIQRRIEEIGKL